LTDSPPPKRKPGRPKGLKNKPTRSGGILWTKGKTKDEIRATSARTKEQQYLYDLERKQREQIRFRARKPGEPPLQVSDLLHKEPLKPIEPVVCGEDDVPLPIALEDKQTVIEYIQIKERELELKEGLPHLYGFKWYTWARDFFESREKIVLLCAANQISKSSTQIRKCIEWATNVDLWPHLWRHKPKQFWYLYPTSNQATIEYETKWQQFLPQGKYKEDPRYGWKAQYKNKEIFSIYFNSGVTIYFKTYGQDASSLQTGTVDYIALDEEIPVELYEELMFRISSSDGYFSMVFTATLGQEFWRACLEPNGKEQERLPNAFKQMVSMYDCLYYEDGTPSHWSEEKILQVKNRCSTNAEIQKRVYGRFIVDSDKKYESFDMARHLKPGHPVPSGWHIYVGADPGSGGKDNHPAALCYVAVRPDFQQGRVIFSWRGDNIATTASDIVEKNLEIKKERKYKPTAQFYDWASRDFFEIAARMGDPFQPAEKSHDKGEQVLNTLFKNDMLLIYDGEGDNYKLAGEISSLQRATPKNKAKDDLCDALRYAVSKIPWDWASIKGDRDRAKRTEQLEEYLSPAQLEIRDRRKAFEHKEEERRITSEFEEFNELYGN